MSDAEMDRSECKAAVLETGGVSRWEKQTSVQENPRAIVHGEIFQGGENPSECY